MHQVELLGIKNEEAMAPCLIEEMVVYMISNNQMWSFLLDWVECQEFSKG